MFICSPKRDQIVILQQTDTKISETKVPMSSPRSKEFSAVNIYCDLLSSPHLAENLAVNKNIGTMSSPRLAEFSAVNICWDLLSSPCLAENLAVNKTIVIMSSPRLAEFSAVNYI